MVLHRIKYKTFYNNTMKGIVLTRCCKKGPHCNRCQNVTNVIILQGCIFMFAYTSNTYLKKK